MAMAAAGMGKKQKNKNAASHFDNASGKKILVFYPHRSRDLVSPVCRIFF